MANLLATNTLGLITNVPIEAKNDDSIRSFIKDFPEFTGKVILYKNTKYFEDNGEIYQRHYDYDIDKGKYRKASYKEKPWKIVVEGTS